MDKYLHCLMITIIMIIINRCSKYSALFGDYKSINNSPLFDIGHNSLEIINGYYSDILMSATLIYFIIRWLYGNIDIVIIFMYIMSIILIIRMISFNLTSIPPALIEYMCSGRDYMFSGHISTMIIITILTILYSRYNLEKYILSILSIIEIYLLIASRQHYSVDVYIGVIISSLITYYINGYLSRYLK